MCMRTCNVATNKRKPPSLSQLSPSAVAHFFEEELGRVSKKRRCQKFVPNYEALTLLRVEKNCANLPPSFYEPAILEYLFTLN